MEIKNKIGEDGLTKDESQENNIYSQITAYNMLINDCKYTHEKALKYLGISEDLFQNRKNIYENLCKEYEKMNDEIDRITLQEVAKHWHSKGKDISNLAKQFEIGKEIEKEHGKDYEKIALEHLAENINYYSEAKPKDWAKKELKEEGKSLKKASNIILKAKIKF